MKSDEKVNILMVDDQPAKLLSYEVILADLDEHLIKATSGTEALDILLKNDIAVVLMDVSMPELDGFELADMIRQHPRFQKTAIIFISGVHLTDSDKINAYRRGAVDYISVPVVPDVLRAKVSVFAELHRKTRMLERMNTDLEKRVEERTRELQESELQFRTLANSIPQLAWMAHADGSIFWYNDRWYEYTGLRAEELKDFGWRKVHHPEHVERIDDGLKRCRKNGELWEDTFPLLGKGGEYGWFLTRAVPIIDSQGTIVRWFGTATDISRQIAAEDEIKVLNQQLQQRVSELETLMQVLPVGIAMAHDSKGVSITGNAAFNQLFGTNGYSVPGGKSNGSAKPSPAIYVGRKRIEVSELPLQRAAISGNPIEGTEIRLVSPEGKIKHVLASASPLMDQSGKSRGSVGAFFDVTERKLLEDELRQRAELLELASEAVIVRDMEGTVRFWSSGAESVYGWRRDEILGQNIHQVLKTVFSTPYDEIEASLLKSSCWAGNLHQKSKDGRDITVASRKSYNREANVVLEINRDISAQLKAEEALRENEKLAAMGRVAGIIAHEINNPLEAITNAFFLLRDHPSLDAEAQHLARLAEQELQRVSHITKQTLGFYRESRQPIAISLTEMLDDVVELQIRKLHALNISVQKDYLVPGNMVGFPVELRQVFLNLFGNAVQAIGSGGRLKLRVHEATDWESQRRGVCVAIVDTGSGIRAEDAKKLFQPFFSTKSSKGTGLGLWISQGIVQKYEGRISFRSFVTEGRSTTCFRIFFPVASMSQSRMPTSANESVLLSKNAARTTNGVA